jgi:hypothetical protein
MMVIAAGHKQLPRLRSDGRAASGTIVGSKRSNLDGGMLQCHGIQARV